eukprot:603029-Alexandrium_andersonii.AAC.1
MTKLTTKSPPCSAPTAKRHRHSTKCASRLHAKGAPTAHIGRERIATTTDTSATAAAAASGPKRTQTNPATCTARAATHA